ncbi:MAG TPA: shikimate dehydrogenase [Trichocoleus sp.]|jgi:shikimate dehydrogenase
MINGKTQLLGVIGHPIEHSLSPVMHNAAIEQLGANFVYLPFPIAPANLPQALEGFRAVGLKGFSVTIPHKQAIMPLLSEISPVAQAIGAVNTVCWTESGWSGTNTDVTGFLAPLIAKQQDWTKATALILGNGGAARAVVAGCHQLGYAQIQVVGRNPQKLEEFLQSWSNSSFSGNLSVHTWNELPDLLPNTDLLVNTTPIGMYPQTDASPLTTDEMAKLRPGSIAYDLIYTPRPTQFLQQAQAQGAIGIDGLEMLVQQGAAALELWLEMPAPVAVMREALLGYLQKSGKP